MRSSLAAKGPGWLAAHWGNICTGSGGCRGRGGRWDALLCSAKPGSPPGIAQLLSRSCRSWSLRQGHLLPCTPVSLQEHPTRVPTAPTGCCLPAELPSLAGVLQVGDGCYKNEVGEKRSRRWPCEGFCCTLSPLAAERSCGPRPRRQLRSRSKAADRRQKLQPKSVEQPGLISTTFPGAEPIPLAHLEMFVLRGSSRRLCLGQDLTRSSQGRRQ